MRFSLIFLLAGATAASAVSPVDTATHTVQTAAVRSAVSARAGASLIDGETLPELYPLESADVGPQVLMIPKVRKTLFEAGADIQYYYTSNALLSEKGNVDTGILLSTAYAGLAPTPIDLGSGQFAWRLGYREQFYNYGLDKTSNQLNNLDFNVGTAYLGARYTFGSNWTVSAGIDYNRYLSMEQNFNEFYTEALPQWGVEKIVPINDRNYLTLGYFGSYHLTYTDPQPNTNSNDRLDSVLLLTSVSELAEKVVLQPYYRFQQSHYTNQDRDEVINTFGVALAYMINAWSSVRVFSNYEVRSSNDSSVSDYHKFDTGVGVSVGLKF
jgi:hypothetical protein